MKTVANYCKQNSFACEAFNVRVTSINFRQIVLLGTTVCTGCVATEFHSKKLYIICQCTCFGGILYMSVVVSWNHVECLSYVLYLWKTYNLIWWRLNIICLQSIMCSNQFMIFFLLSKTFRACFNTKYRINKMVAQS